MPKYLLLKHYRGGPEPQSALLCPRPGGDHRRTGGADRLSAPAGSQPAVPDWVNELGGEILLPCSATTS
jgi:hypothetical protein